MRKIINTIFLVFGLLLITNLSFSQTWDFEDSLSDWTITGGAAELSSEWFYSGIKSAKITSSNDTTITEFQNSIYTEIDARDTVRFRLLAEDLSDIGGFHIFVRENVTGEWSSGWVGTEEIIPNQWNIIEFTIPDSINGVQEFGIQLISKTQEDTPVIYLEDAAIVDYVEPEPMEPLLITYDFEEETLFPFGIGNENGSAELSNTSSYSGFESAKIAMNSDGDLIEFVTYTPPALAPDQLVDFYVLVPQDTSNIASISPYIQFDGIAGDGNEWDGWESTFYETKNLIPGTWHKLTVMVPEYITLQALGLQVQGKTASGSPDIFVDLITTDSAVVALPIISKPVNLKQDSVSQTYAALSWNESEGNGRKSYQVYRANSDGEYSYLNETDSTHFLDTGVQNASTYRYQVSAVDTFGRETEFSDQLVIQTKAYSNEFTWDFETEAEGWIDGAFEDSVQKVDSLSFSGLHAVKLEVPEGEPYNYILTNSISVEAGQPFFFNFFIPEDASNIDGFTISSNITNDTAFVYKSIDEFNVGSWNLFEYEIPDYDSTSFIAFSVISSSTGASPVFIDLITTDPNEKGFPTFTPPSNLSASNVTMSSASLSWTASEGRGNIQYNVYRYLSMSAAPFPQQLIASTTSTSYTDTELIGGADYTYFVKAADSLGRETLPTNEVSIKTTDFASHATFDFEQGLEGWAVNQGTISIDTTHVYSGIYSVEFTSGAAESFFELTSENTEAPGTPTIGDIRLGHTVTYRVWISEEDTAGVSLFQIYMQDGTWNWTSNVVPIEEIAVNEWNELSYTLPESASNLNRIGLQIFGRNPDVNPEATIYIDLISTRAAPVVRPNLTIPENISGEINEGNFEVSWSPSSGKDELKQYNIYFKTNDESSEYELIGSTTETSYTINIESDNSYLVTVTAVDINNRESFPSEPLEFSIITPGVEDEFETPKTFELYHNYPNPFNPSTQIKFDIPEASHVTLRVYDIMGRHVKTLVSEFKTTGKYNATFNAENLASGIYLYKLQAGSFTKVQRMLLVK